MGPVSCVTNKEVVMKLKNIAIVLLIGLVTLSSPIALAQKGGGGKGGKGGSGGGSKGGKGQGGWPSGKTGKPSGGGRNNAPPKM